MLGPEPDKARATDLAEFERALDALRRRGRLRSLQRRTGLDFASNDYLALAGSPEIAATMRAAIERGVAAGAGGSRLLRGNDPEFEALEAEAAAFFKAESALFFGGGYVANYAIFAGLPQRGDLVVHDELIHASVHDGVRAGKAEVASARHNDAQSFEDALRRWRQAGGTGRPWLAVESLYSMEGDRAPLGDLIAVAERYDGMLVIDEAHATGVHGPDGRGLAAEFEGRGNVVSLHTCGKGLGVSGALVLGPKVLTDYMINRSRPFIYATAPSPLVAAGVRAALLMSRFGGSRRARLQGHIARASDALCSRCGIAPSGSQIQPIIVGADQKAVALAAALQDKGFDVRAVRPPTVSEGTARLRISLTLNVDEVAVAALFEALAEALQEVPR